MLEIDRPGDTHRRGKTVVQNRFWGALGGGLGRLWGLSSDPQGMLEGLRGALGRLWGPGMVPGPGQRHGTDGTSFRAPEEAHSGPRKLDARPGLGSGGRRGLIPGLGSWTPVRAWVVGSKYFFTKYVFVKKWCEDCGLCVS